MRRPSRSRQPKPTPATTGSRELATQLFGRRPEHTLALLRAAWATAVGPELAWRTEVLALEGRTLRVRVPDAHWRKVLHRLRREILTKMYAIAGSLSPKAFGFQEGVVTTPYGVRMPPREPAPLPTVEAPASIREAAGQIADPELRARFTESAARYLSSNAALRDK
jgi:hypothetical protein